eukprot:6383818-Amphidinium_carterae.1
MGFRSSSSHPVVLLFSVDWLAMSVRCCLAPFQKLVRRKEPGQTRCQRYSRLQSFGTTSHFKQRLGHRCLGALLDRSP